jgi:hypothetical protein
MASAKAAASASDQVPARAKSGSFAASFMACKLAGVHHLASRPCHPPPAPPSCRFRRPPWIWCAGSFRCCIACPGTLWLLDQILANGAITGPALDGFPGDTLLTPLERPRGLPIGNLTSQFLANFHLNQLDHRLSALPGIRVFLRYVDDLALFADRPEPLQRARVVLEAELSDLRLRQRLRLQHKAVVAGILAVAAARASLQSWNAHLAHGHTRRLRQRLFAGIPYAADLP